MTRYCYNSMLYWEKDVFGSYNKEKVLLLKCLDGSHHVDEGGAYTTGYDEEKYIMECAMHKCQI